MIKSKLFYSVASLIMICAKSTAQVPDLKGYVILTVEDSFSKGFEGVKKYYWIIEEDSIKSANSKFLPLILSGFSKANFEDCCKGADIDPYVITKADSVFDIGDDYFKKSRILKKLIISKRKKIQDVKKTWVIKNNEEHIKFYLTPIRGRFCSSEFAQTGQWRTGYSGKIMIPYSSFEPNLKFWSSKIFLSICSLDFSKVKFSMIR